MRALIAMSGGVDSAVAVRLAQEAGYDCEGVTMRLFYNEDLGESPMKSCCGLTDVQDAAASAARLGIPHRAVSFAEDFRREVMDRFVRVYEAGGTPNPCIDCNRAMKFEALLNYALERGFDILCTGHYARTVWDGTAGRWRLYRAADEQKDQSYVLYMLTQPQLEHIRFPLGTLRKAETRALARSLGLPNADKPDSQDICFVPDGDYLTFLRQYTGRAFPPGDFLDVGGAVIGQHRNAAGYTPGQRRGLGVAAERRLYVIEKDMQRNTVTLGGETALFRREVFLGDLNWIAFPALTAAVRCEAKLRYRMAPQPCEAVPLPDGRVRLVFDEAQRAPTPGQAAVLYRGDEVLGGGTICEGHETDHST